MMTIPRWSSKARPWIAAGTALGLVGAMLSPAISVAAVEPTDMVLEWNLNATVTLNNAPTATPPGLGQAPPASPIHLAMVHGAIYDAVNAIDGSRTPYLDGLTAPASASEAAAAATAAHHVLVALVPATLPQVVVSLDAMYAASLAKIGDSADKTAGITVGAAAAAAMLANRSGDGRFGSHTFTPGTGPGVWQLVPPLNANVLGWAALVRPFTMQSPGQFRTDGPLDLASAEYAAEFNEVKALGAQVNSGRTPEQTALAAFVTGNPFMYVNRAFREVASAEGLSPADQARLFALTSMASADAMIGCWNDKDYWNFWRPPTAIRNADIDGNPATVADPSWSALYSTPGYPEHPSGYNCFTGAMMHSAKVFFRTDKMSFDLTSPGTTPPTTRHYDRFTDFLDDTIDGRIYTGFHFRTADTQGVWLGKRAANWAASHYFRPAP